jgi:polyribonucleotide nucleotidyltransferase
MLNVQNVSAKVGNHTISIETGKLAKQASGSVVISTGDSIVLVTACSGGHSPDARFFPLVVDYVEKQYAAGRIPGGFLKREARLRDHEILVSRMTDRPIRPLFPDGYKGDIQITATVLSHDGGEQDTDVLCITGASAALMLSSAPFEGPIAGVRVARVNGEFVANPSKTQLESADINIMMAASKEAIVMVEGESKEVSEADLMAALDFGFNAVQDILDAQIKLASVAGRAKEVFESPTLDPAILSAVQEFASARLAECLDIREKLARYAALDALKAEVKATLAERFEGQEDDIKKAFDEVKGQTMRRQVLDNDRRLDGRGLADIRSIWTEVGTLPRAHGSAVFTRGETQALVVATLGTERDAKMEDGLMGKYDERVMLHYNFPPFSVGEVKPLRGPGRREVGHGFLARRGIDAVLPRFEDFPYVIRLVSEVLESNGSSSMATVCGSSLALMDAGVPLKAPVAGIAMGLIAEGNKFKVLSDILGDEDHLGDMDFKIVGTADGVTSVQMDIKVKGLPQQVMADALEQARKGRLHILGEMAKSLDASRDDLSEHAPRITTIKISVDRIRDVIGSGGKTIRSIQERTGCSVNVEDDGTVKIASSDRSAAAECVEIIEALTAEPVVGEIYLGQVAKVTDFGAFVTILPNVDGLCHISELTEERVERVEDVCREGDEIVVKCVGVERNGKIRLSRKEALGKEPTIHGLKLQV